MNPSVRIMPVKIFPDGKGQPGLSVAENADAIGYAWTNGAAVLSNSWGYSLTPDDPAGIQAINEAIQAAVTQGRGGKGCPVIFASGNRGGWGFPVAYPAYLPTVLGVGATDVSDNVFSYTQLGDSLDLVAPSGLLSGVGDVWSTDQMGSAGYNPNFGDDDPKFLGWDCGGYYNDENYNCHFGGTSAACPVVAGAASLLLARDPDMLARDTTSDSSSDYNVYDVLCYSAVPLGGEVPNSTYGYGRVDAYRAVLSIARGDANNDGQVTISDISLLIDHEQITGVPIPVDSLLGDISCDGDITISDISILIDHLFITQAPLPLPCFEFND